jgi:para-aminobenzoate synthetase/4-amino-4-deoxychorismate lyase
MEIIRELERQPRGAYTGAVGMVAPDGDLRFNVAIRTLWIDRSGGGALGIGSGIVYDSDPAAEYEECLLKARFLTDPDEPFQLIETLRWSESAHYDLLQRHLDRLAGSARYFGLPCDIDAVRAALEAAVESLAGTQRVRLLLDRDGAIAITATPIAPPDAAACLRYAISDRAIDSRDPHRYHKTTRRDLLDSERERLAVKTGCDEVLFVNERGELTEGCNTNLFVERGGSLLTPPLSCGILDGTLRRELLENGERSVEECVLYPADLEAADAVWLGNSVRGLRRAQEAGGDRDALSRGSRQARAGGAAGHR